MKISDITKISYRNNYYVRFSSNLIDDKPTILKKDVVDHFVVFDFGCFPVSILEVHKIVSSCVKEGIDAGFIIEDVYSYNLVKAYLKINRLTKTIKLLNYRSSRYGVRTYTLGKKKLLSFVQCKFKSTDLSKQQLYHHYLTEGYHVLYEIPSSFHRNWFNGEKRNASVLTKILPSKKVFASSSILHATNLIFRNASSALIQSYIQDHLSDKASQSEIHLVLKNLVNDTAVTISEDSEFYTI